MFDRLIRKISSLARTTTFRRISQENAIDNEQNKPIPIENNLKEFSTSIPTFKVLAEPGNIFVDKSLLIEKLLNTNNNAFLFTRPRRWGKTLNIDMLEMFFQADVDEAIGIPNFEKQGQKYLFEKLKIAGKKILKDPLSGKPSNQNVIDFQGQFPVIKLTTNDLSPIRLEGIIQGFKDMLKPAFEKHSYVLNSDKIRLFNDECELIKAYVHGKSKISWEDIGKSLSYLIKVLNIVYGRRVVLLIDEYDKFLNDLLAENSPFYSDALMLFKLLLGPIKNNDKLLLTVFTGATKMVKTGLFTGLNHFYYDSVVESEYSEFFGFTESEVNLLLSTLIDLNPKLQQKEVKDLVTLQYNGYRIGKEIIYNPWSIMHCFNRLHKDIANPYSQFWASAGSTKLIENAVKAIPSIKHIEELIINGETRLENVRPSTFEEAKTNEAGLFSLLLDSGYITKLKDNLYKVPNYEVNSYFIETLLPLWLEKRFPKINLELLKKNFEKTEAYGQTFQQEFLDRLEYTYHNEKYFQILMALQFDMQDPINADYIKYNKQQTTENIRTDILVIPKKLNLTSVFILELKKAETFGGIDKKIKEALLQVFKKNYVNFVLKLAEKSENKRWKDFHIRAIVFSPDELDKKCILTIKELKFCKENLQIALKKFELIKIKEDEKEKKKKDKEDKKDKKNIEEKTSQKNKKNMIEKKNKVDEKLIEIITSLSNSIIEYPNKSK